MATVSGQVFLSAAVANNGTVNIPYTLGPHMQDSGIDFAADKVFLGQNQLAPAAATVAKGTGHVAVVTNKSGAAWPAWSYVTFECPYVAPADENMEQLIATVADHEIRIDALEAAMPPATLVGGEGRDTLPTTKKTKK